MAATNGSFSLFIHVVSQHFVISFAYNLTVPVAQRKIGLCNLTTLAAF